MTSGLGNLVALICIVISIIFAIVTHQATNALWGIARHIRRAVVGCQGAMGQTVNKRPDLKHFQLQDSGALIAAKAHA